MRPNEYVLAPVLGDAGRGFSLTEREGMNMTPVPEHDLARYVAANIHPSAPQAHHEAGHAVAAVIKQVTVPDLRLGTANRLMGGPGVDTSCGSWFDTSAWRLFITFAGPWAQAMWYREAGHSSQDRRFSKALISTWIKNEKDKVKYQKGVAKLRASAKKFGFGSIPNAWESQWSEELKRLWPAVREVAWLLVDGETVTHEKVLAAVDRCRCSESLPDPLAQDRYRGRQD